MSQQMTAEDRAAVEDLLTEFASRIDHGRAADVADLFTRDGRIVTPQFTLDGRDAIRAQFTERAKDGGRVSRHMWSNLRLNRIGDNRIESQCVVQTYIGSGTPPVVPQDVIVGDSLDIIAKENGVWRFAERRLVIAFLGGR